MRTHPAIGILKAFGWLFLLGGILVGIWDFANAVNTLRDAQSGSLADIERAAAGAFAVMGFTTIFTGAFVCTLCFVFAVIAEGTLANGRRLEVISRQLSPAQRMRQIDEEQAPLDLQ
jgi:hypothetical protein